MQVNESVFPPEIRTGRLLLRPMRLSDAEDIFAYASDDQVTAYMLWPTHESIDVTREYISHTMKAYETFRHFDYAIEHLESGRVIGAGGSITELPETPAPMEIGYVLNREFWGQGYMPEAMDAFIRYLFEYKDIHRVEAIHMVDNPKSGRVMQKLGMTKEGVHTDKVFAKGNWRSVCSYSLINPAHTR